MQLRLFPAPRPLLERFGVEFFRRVPAVPGVYVFGGEGGEVLYVGQSRNLRVRLRSYGWVRPETAPRRLVRLVHAVRSITWEVCDSAVLARLRENELLRLLKPRFNRANTYPEAGGYLALTTTAERLEFRLVREGPAAADEGVYGPFKSWHALRRGLGALVRLLWVAAAPGSSVHQWPGWVLDDLAPAIAVVSLPPTPGVRWSTALTSFFAGQSDGLIEVLRELVVREVAQPFLRTLCQADLERLTEFYRWGPRRGRIARDQAGLGDEYLRPAELADLVTWASNGTRPGNQGFEGETSARGGSCLRASSSQRV